MRVVGQVISKGVAFMTCILLRQVHVVFQYNGEILRCNAVANKFLSG